MIKQRVCSSLGFIKNFLILILLICLAASCALELEEFTITFNPDGGTGTMEPVSAKAGQKVTLSANSFAKGTDFFDGWIGISPDGTILEYDDRAEVEMPEHDLELFACWWNGLPKANLPSAVGTVSPSGGYIFFDKGRVVDGWQYMEAAPADLKIEVAPGEVFVEDPYCFSWGEFPSETSYQFGKGKTNTASIVAAGKGKDSAAKRCDDHVIYNNEQVFDDWFLPSEYELSKMNAVLIRNNKGSFSNYVYWSSTEYGGGQAKILRFERDSSGPPFADKRARFRVRPVRMF